LIYDITSSSLADYKSSWTQRSIDLFHHFAPKGTYLVAMCC